MKKTNIDESLNDLKLYLNERRNFVDNLLKTHLDSPNKDPKIIYQAMRYSVLNGGKRLRPILAFLAHSLFDGFEKDVYYAVSALELIHCYSLVHDDLPSLDNDDLRRGKLTCHKKFGEDIAILTGDALLTKSFELLSNIENAIALKKTLKEVTVYIGTFGMIGGQVLDLQSENISIIDVKTTELLKKIHAKKTAALIQLSLVTGAILANANEKNIEILRNYGFCLGMMFQITDDILDVTANKKTLGKKGSDIFNKKLTYPYIYGIDESKKIVGRYKHKGLKLLDGCHIENNSMGYLRDLLVYVEHRCY